MKKFILLSIVVCLVFTLSSCSFLFKEKKVEDETSSTDISQLPLETSSTADVSDDASADVSEDVSEESSQQEETSSIPQEEEKQPYSVDLGDIVITLLESKAFKYGDNVIYRHDAANNYSYNIILSYTAQKDITDFRLLNYDSGVALCVGGVDANVGAVKTGESVYAKQYVNDMDVSTGFSYKNSKGVTEYYYIDIPSDFSGETSPELETPFTVTYYEINQKDAFLTALEHASWDDVVDYYAWFDLDGDCDNELIIRTGFSEAGAYFDFYDVIDGIATQIGYTSAGNSSLVSDGNGVIVHGGHMGYEWASRAVYNNGKLTFEPIELASEGTDNYTVWKYDIITYAY